MRVKAPSHNAGPVWSRTGVFLTVWVPYIIRKVGYQIRKAGYPPTNNTLAARVVNIPHASQALRTCTRPCQHIHTTHTAPGSAMAPPHKWVPRFSNLCGGHVRVMWGGCGIMSRVKSGAVDMHISLGTLCVGPILTPHPSHTPHTQVEN